MGGGVEVFRGVIIHNYREKQDIDLLETPPPPNICIILNMNNYMCHLLIVSGRPCNNHQKGNSFTHSFYTRLDINLGSRMFCCGMKCRLYRINMCDAY